jgi:hypothetical protein
MSYNYKILNFIELKPLSLIMKNRIWIEIEMKTVEIEMQIWIEIEMKTEIK